MADDDSGLLSFRVSFPLTNTSVLDSQTISAVIPGGVPEGTYNVMVTNLNGQKGILFASFEMKQHCPPEIVKVNGLCISPYPSHLYPDYEYSGTSNIVIPIAIKIKIVMKYVLFFIVSSFSNPDHSIEVGTQKS